MAVNKKKLSSHVPHIFLCFMAVLWVSNPFSHPSTSYGRLQLRHQAPLLRVTERISHRVRESPYIGCWILSPPIIKDVGYYSPYIGCWILSPPIIKQREFWTDLLSTHVRFSVFLHISSLSQINFAPSACPSWDKAGTRINSLYETCVLPWQVQYPSGKWPNP